MSALQNGNASGRRCDADPTVNAAPLCELIAHVQRRQRRQRDDWRHLREFRQADAKHPQPCQPAELVWQLLQLSSAP